MNKNIADFFIVLLLMLIFSIGCSSETKTEELTRGKLKFVKTLKYGSVGTHGSQGWYVSDQIFYVNDKRWKPDGVDVKGDIANCEPSPDESVEALKCYSFADLKELVYVLRIKDDKPEWVTASDKPYGNGKNLGEWTTDGRWLLFFDNLFNVETSENREVKGLPSPPEDKFRATSPDLEKIVYQGDCFSGGNLSEDVERRRKQTCDNRDDYVKKKIEILWIIEAKTGETKLIELSREKYDWLIWNNEKFQSKSDWLKFFGQQLVWEKAKDGKFQLVFPK
jgi:hypothetical protein